MKTLKIYSGKHTRPRVFQPTPSSVGVKLESVNKQSGMRRFSSVPRGRGTLHAGRVRSPYLRALAAIFFAIVQAAVVAEENSLPPFRPPAVPLVACDPYFSIWSQGDKLTDL